MKGCKSVVTQQLGRKYVKDVYLGRFQNHRSTCNKTPEAIRVNKNCFETDLLKFKTVRKLHVGRKSGRADKSNEPRKV